MLPTLPPVKAGVPEWRLSVGLSQVVAVGEIIHDAPSGGVVPASEASDVPTNEAGHAPAAHLKYSCVVTFWEAAPDKRRKICTAACYFLWELQEQRGTFDGNSSWSGGSISLRLRTPGLFSSPAHSARSPS